MAARRERRREVMLPYAEIGVLRRAVLRTAVLRILLGLLLVGAFLAAVVVAYGRDARPDPLLPPGTTGMIVLDLSASAGVHPEIGEALRRVASTDERTGVIVFSDVAYELVPPGTPGRHLAPMIRYFSAAKSGRAAANPWSTTFSAGTRLSAGIEAAQNALLRDRVEDGTIVVASDLEVFADDVARLPAVLMELHRHGTKLRIIPLDARDEQKRFFEQLAGPDVFIDSALVAAAGGGLGARDLAEEQLPWLFIAIALFLAVLLAANERLCARVEIPRAGDAST